VNRPRSIALLLLPVFALGVGAAVAAQKSVKGTHCKVFPASNAWNQRVDSLPVAAGSDAMIASIGLGSHVHADFGSGRWEGAPIGIPYVIVSSKTKKRKVSFEYADESDRARYPVPKNAPVEGGRKSSGDRHVIMVDKSRCKLYELYAAYPRQGGRSWRAGSGAVWSLKSNKLRPAGWTSADAAGLPIFPGLARYDEVASGAIRHALRFTAPRTRSSYVYPARHHAGVGSSSSLPPMGLRVRLKSGVDVSSYPRQARIVLTALQRYGMLLADNGSPWYISGAPNSRWNNDELHAMDNLTGRDFEVVDTSSLPTPGR
jgi:hypothetical protein